MLRWLAEFLQPVGLQFDLAAAGVALVALLFSVVSYRGQRRISVETLRMQAENDLLGWLNGVIETLVATEFLVRDWARNPQSTQFALPRDERLQAISIAIDKGRMYFPRFPSDKIGPEAPSSDAPRDLLDDLVDIYDLILKLDPQKPGLFDSARLNLLLKKRAFLAHAREKIDLARRNQFLKS